MTDTISPPRSKPFFAAIEPQAPDPLLALIGAYRADPRPEKIDLGIGVYRDEQGHTPVMSAVKRAEVILVDGQTTKAYLGAEGDADFVSALTPLVFGVPTTTVRGVQTPGGTGALRLAAELIAYAGRGSTVWIGTPTWPNHEAILASAGLQIARYSHFDVKTQRLCFNELRSALAGARPGDVALLHGSSHNPTGADLTADQWHEIAALLAARDVLPLIDLAYQGLGAGLEADAQGTRIVVEATGQALVAYSCDKNFGLYRERVGALFAVGDTASAGRAHDMLLSLARANWSMPPDHGAAIVRTILTAPELAADWRRELEAMQGRLAAVRNALASADQRLTPIARQTGLFSMLPLSPTQIAELRTAHGIYMAPSGRLNVAGLNSSNLERFVDAVAAQPW